MPRYRFAVVGAGLAGLACAREIAGSVPDVLLVEKAQRPGGRVASHVTSDGFVVDRGFQVILDSYPSVPSASTVSRSYFDSGAILTDGYGFSRIMNPIFHPAWWASAALSPAVGFIDKVKLASLVAALASFSDETILARCASSRDQSTLQYLRSLGFSEVFIERLVRPFFGGVFLDNDLETSCGLFRYYLKKFASGRAFVPAGGMSELPAALARELPQGCLRCNTEVVGIRRNGDRVSGLQLADGEVIEAEQFVFATDEPATRRLFGLEQSVPCREVTTVYLKSRRSLYEGATLVLPSRRGRTVQHFVQITNAAPAYAPAGWHLVSASVLGVAEDSDEAVVKRTIAEIAAIFPAAEGSLEPVDVVRISYAFRVQEPGFAGKRLPFPQLENASYTGDQMAHACIEAALRHGSDLGRRLLHASKT